MSKQYAFVGSGNMGGAVARAVCRGAGAENVIVFDPSAEKVEAIMAETGCRGASSADNAAYEADFIFICVKPYMVGQVLGELSDILGAVARAGKRQIIVSIAAGVSIADIGAALSSAGAPELPIIRLLPNTPVAVGKGMTVMACSKAVAKEESEELVKALSAGGEVMPMEESLIDKATAVFSSSPAFVYMFIEALADGGVKSGVPREMAQRLAAQAVMGSAAMVLESGNHPGALKDQVCSPGGSTIVGVEQLEKGGMRAAVISAVYETYQKTLLLGKK